MTSIMFWNCKGAKKKEASHYLRNLIGENGMFFIGLIETKMENLGREDVRKLVGNDWEFHHVAATGTSGGILTLWKYRMASFKIIDSSKQCIIGKLIIPKGNKAKVCIVYGIKICMKEENFKS
ncbi:hypothetical protein KFK09_022774 [Dendrobium nobile]|uniref:Endonuclease/exonuclease/phosphatase domain-containing protein n=1 Tax=Dendrobium nobile TaxID=94219 RepID=A0A8T3AJM5_DENNO|nr:hypothetical protein KFK09_022774 [Dendrobium nobile]